MDKLWSKSEIAHLERHADSQNLTELAQRFHTDTDTVRKKMDELGLASSSTSAEMMDAAMKKFEEGVQLLYDKKYEAAATAFEQSIAESDTRQLSDRARQYLQICRDRTEEADVGDDPYLAAVYEKNSGNLDAASELCKKQGKAVETEEKYAYLMASVHALAEEEDEALSHLARAIELEPKNRVHAYHDPDFASLRGREEFSRLLGSGAQPSREITADAPELDLPADA